VSKAFLCRCEDVTLHEAEAALAKGHDDIESLKRFTGFGTGWCQGKNCLAGAAALLRAHGKPAPEPFTARPPFRPVALADLVALAEMSDADERDGKKPH